MRATPQSATGTYVLLDEPLFEPVARHALSDGRHLARTDEVADIYVEVAGGSIVAVEALNAGEPLPVTLIRECPRITGRTPRGGRFIHRRSRTGTPSRCGVCVDATEVGKGVHCSASARRPGPLT